MKVRYRRSNKVDFNYNRNMTDLGNEIIRITEANTIIGEQSVQTLWSGYGEIKCYQLSGGKYPTVIAKHIRWPEITDHPRGWNTSLSHQRKLKSYQVEKRWYESHSQFTTDRCRIPFLIHSKAIDSGILLVLEDLNHSGFDRRYDPSMLQINQVKNVLEWLANFHATFMGKSPEGLWKTGTYWHLTTRPDEWENMQNVTLKRNAKAIDERLDSAKFQTFVHGDAKLANFCFSESNEVAAVDFQYVGQGCGMKDVAYFLSSCFEEEDCERYEKMLLDHYFHALQSALGPASNFQELQEEWRRLYPFAWADFYRFLDGWSPGHWKMHGYSKRLTQEVLEQLK